MLYSLNGSQPKVAADAWVAPGAQLIGQVTVEAEASIWFNTVLRGDTDRIVIGSGSNVQDGTVVHCDPGYPVILGVDVTVGHSCTIHGCTIGDHCLVGMGSVILTGARLGAHCLVAAGSLITEHKEFPDGSVIMGRPAQVVRTVGEKELAMIRRGAERYRQNAQFYARQLKAVSSET